MNTAKKLYQTQAKLYRLNLQYARVRMLERKQDTHRKIQLGGLIIKAGLHHEPTAVLLGLLLDAKENMAYEDEKNKAIMKNKKTTEHLREYYRLKGDIVFTMDKIQTK